LNKYAFHYYSLLLEIIELNEEKKEIINNPNIDRKDKERLINKINSQIDGLIYTRVEKAPQHQNSSSIFDYIAEQYKKYVNQNGEIRNG
jgi:F0F1-type ATP synthase delta subunit